MEWAEMGFVAMGWPASTPEQADYCLGQEQRGLQAFDACMRELEKNAENWNWTFGLMIAGVIAAIYFYNKGRADREKEGFQQ